MSNLYCLLITQNRAQDIKELISNLYPTFDGIISCVHKPFLDDTYLILEENKGKGRVITREFFPYHHSHSMNELFYCRHLKNNDKILILDSPERATDKLISEIKDIFKWMEKNNIGCVYGDGRPYLVNYIQTMFFSSSPHWQISGQIQSAISWGKEQKDSYIINTRHNNPSKSFCENPIRYTFCYHADNNEIYSTYYKYGQEALKYHTIANFRFKEYCQENLKLNFNNLDDLVDYMRKIEKKEIIPDECFLDYLEDEFRAAELYQLKVLNYNFMGERPNDPIGMHPRFKWSVKEHIKTGNGWNNPDFENLVLQYEKQLTK